MDTLFKGELVFEPKITDYDADKLKNMIVDQELKRMCACPWIVVLDNENKYILKCRKFNSDYSDYSGWLRVICDRIVHDISGQVYTSKGVISVS